uniref:Ninja-family protein n=1 Tax=Nelumbo nucifera TaxID=4432 RepID=A0A822YSH1_NELNU|nr:TPA_asm: hypothetical protein HUJ06_005693 [Nelumbo nucifera]
MGEARRTESGEIGHLSMQMNVYPRDLLKRFSAVNCGPTEFSEAGEDTEEVELNLELSLGGCFGVDPREKRLVRSSSITGLTTLARDEDEVAPPPVGCSALTRTCCPHTENEEERIMRKELQCIRRMEAKRKRSEKQRNFKTGKDRTFSEGNCEEDKPLDDEALTSMNLKETVEGVPSYQGFAGNTTVSNQQQQKQQQQQYMMPNGFTQSVAPPLGLPTRPAASHPHGIDTSMNGKGNVLAAGAAAALRGCPPPSSQGSLGSQGSSSSGISDFEGGQVQGTAFFFHFYWVLIYLFVKAFISSL